MNLSGVALSEAETNLLSKGLSFCPTPRHMKKEEILDDLEKFFRRLRLKEFFLEEEEEEENDAHALFRPPSTWMPPKRRDAALETYINQTRIDVERQLERLQDKRCKDNLPSDERLALKHLRQRTDIIIKPADKGSAVVVLSKEDYIKEADRQLNESVFYRKLSADPTSQYSTEVKQCVDSMFRRGLIDKRVKDFLVPHHPRAARFYLLPKIHKPGNPGRPIVASNGAPTENISRFADFYLRPSVIQLPSYIRNTTDFINKLRGLPRLPSGCLLVTLDVSSLVYQHSTRGRHHSLRGISQSSRDTGTSHGRSLPADPVSFIEELVCFQQEKLFTDSRHCHGNTYGAIVCKFVHGKA